MQAAGSRLRSLRGTSSRTFFVYPALTLLLELLIRRRLRLHPLGLLLMLWGYAQYRLVGAYLMQTGRARVTAPSRGTRCVAKERQVAHRQSS